MKNISDFCGYDYKSLIYFENIIKKLKIPKIGKIVQLGSNFLYWKNVQFLRTQKMYRLRFN